MPKYPEICSGVHAVRLSAFSSLSARLERHAGERYPFHVGDTWMAPAPGCRMEDLRESDHPGMHRYAPTRGLRTLLDAVVERTRRRTGAPTERDDVLISAGATGGLSAVLGSLLAPGDEVAILAPFWPLIDGIVRSFRGVPVAVPVLDTADDAAGLVGRLEDARTARTVAVYLNPTNNPTGRVLRREAVRAIADWAARRDLWILSDEVYEDYVYDGEHTYGRPFAPERTFSVHSCSKAFGMAGNRCGWVVGPTAVMESLTKISVHTFYSTPTASQIAAVEALAGPGDAWVNEARELYREIGRESAAILGVEPPQGSTFLFLDVSSRLGPGGLVTLLEACADRGILVAPGPSFGPFPGHIRVCFTSAPPDVTRRGMTALAEIVKG